LNLFLFFLFLYFVVFYFKMFRKYIVEEKEIGYFQNMKQIEEKTIQDINNYLTNKFINIINNSFDNNNLSNNFFDQQKETINNNINDYISNKKEKIIKECEKNLVNINFKIDNFLSSRLGTIKKRN